MNAHLDHARLLVDRDRYAEAEKELMLALGEQPDSVLAHGLLAACLLERQAYKDATEHACQAVHLAPDSSWPHSVLASVWLARNDPRQARPAAEQALALDPFNASGHVLLGRVAFAESRWPEALNAAEAALEIDPENIDAMNLKAECSRLLGQGTMAEEQLQSALAVDPENSETHSLLGWVALQAGDRAGAKQHFREALRLDPESESASAGVIESIKAWNPAYRFFLKYVFWMQRLDRRSQWMVVIGLYVAYRIASGVAQSNPMLAPLIWPVIAAYLGFVLLTWLARPLANLSLRLHPFGRLALSRDDRQGSNWIGGFLAGAIVCALVAWLGNVDSLWLAALALGGMLLPLAATFSAQRPWPWKPLVVYSLATGFFAFVFAISPFVDTALSGELDAPPQWWKAISGLCTLGFFLGVILSLWIGNILLSIRWRR